MLHTKLLNPPNERERQETVDALKVVEGSQNEPHFNNIVALVCIWHKQNVSGHTVSKGDICWGDLGPEKPREVLWTAHLSTALEL